MVPSTSRRRKTQSAASEYFRPVTPKDLLQQLSEVKPDLTVVSQRITAPGTATAGRPIAIPIRAATPIAAGKHCKANPPVCALALLCNVQQHALGIDVRQPFSKRHELQKTRNPPP